MTQEKNLKKSRSVAKSVIDGSFSVTAFIFTGIMQLGELSINAFLSPSVYADMPSVSFEFSRTKTKNKPMMKKMTIWQSIRRLQKQGFVEKTGDKYRLTKKGKDLADYIKDRQQAIRKKWDGKYRVVIFDVPEKMSKHRDWLRQELYILNYKKLQESVFVSKYPLTRALIREIKRRKIGNCINYILADKVYKNVSD